MQKVLTAEQMREVDRLTTEGFGIPSILLMENAAQAVAGVITEKLGGSVEGKAILVLCGKGNNGGDGAALARILAIQGAYVDILLFGKINETKGDARINFGVLCSEDFEFDDVYSSNFGELREIETKVQWVQFYLHTGQKCDVFVDAIFGTGLTRPIDIWLYNVIHDINFTNEGPLPTPRLSVAVDIPTGLNADTGEMLAEPFRADVTVTFTAPKPGNVLPGAAALNGELVVADIGSPMELINAQASRLFLTEREDVEDWIEETKFSDDSYKNKRGHSLLVVGSESYSGAAVLASNAAMRSGVGLVTMAVPASCKSEVASRSLPDVIVRSIAENESGEILGNAFTENMEMLSGADAIAVGCGLLATDKGIEKFVREIVDSRNVPVILDAGALWFFSPLKPDDDQPAATAGGPDSLPKPARSKGPDQSDPMTKAPLILTPHEGEFMRLLGTDDKDAIKDRVAAVRDFANKNNVILVLKGERVLIGSPDGRVVVNPTGNSGLGKAGNGDTLTGILTGFVAQAARMDIDIFETVVAAVYVAGMAGDVAEKKYGKRVMTASDVRECLADVFSELTGGRGRAYSLDHEKW